MWRSRAMEEMWTLPGVHDLADQQAGTVFDRKCWKRPDVSKRSWPKVATWAVVGAVPGHDNQGPTRIRMRYHCYDV